MKDSLYVPIFVGDYMLEFTVVCASDSTVRTVKSRWSKAVTDNIVKSIVFFTK